MGNEENEDSLTNKQPSSIPEISPWAQLKHSRDSEAYSSAWLEIQAGLFEDEMLNGVVVLQESTQGQYRPTAVWPKELVGSALLAQSVELAIKEKKPLIKADKPGESYIVACPVEVGGEICGAVALAVRNMPEEALNKALEKLEWGIAWLKIHIHTNKYTSTDRLITVLELVATSLHSDRFQASATAVATELASLMGCERVSIGFLRGRHSELIALSHSASFSKKSNMIHAIEAAMDEAIDQHTTVVFPPYEEAALQVTKAHEVLLREQGDGSVCTILLTEGERLIGAMLLEHPHGERISENTLQLCEHAASLIGPILDVKRKDDRWLPGKILDSTRAQLKKLIGPSHVGFKLSAFLIVLALIFFTFAESEYRVTADARLEGVVQRAISVPFAGYVVDANVRAGDVVKAGDVLFSLDDRDVRLERLKWESQKLQNSREYSEATAEGDRAKARILSAQVEQADAEISLLDERLARTRVVAPFDSFVVTGDLSQSLGSPVERGDVLFEVAPLDAYRVILKVDERDIESVFTGQMGYLVLSSSPEDALAIIVDRITPLSTAEEGRNYFRVEAILEEIASPFLRPGMEGIVKVEIEERKIIWIWTHKITHWIRMFMWSWWP